MELKGFHRKLTAILSADVASYSRLIQDDEAATVKTLEAYKKIISDLVKQQRGRVVDSPGDNLLAEFASVVDAVQCAVATQKELQARNMELPENRKMQFRIGVNLGDVIEEESRIYGDGVNIAARLESLADPGGICVSKTAFDQIETKLPLGYEFLGEQELKNIAKPVGVYRVLMEPRVTIAGADTKVAKVHWWPHKTVLASTVVVLVALISAGIWNFYWRAPKIEPASKEKMSLPLPDMPSIAVLPFVNMSDDPKMEFLSDGITENIITALSRIPRLLVIARNSTFIYKGKPVKVNQVSEELGVQYVLEGSVQKSDNRIRITTQLIDALKGHHIWADRYDRDLTDVFALQDEITIKILNALRVKFTEGLQTSTIEKYFKGKQGLDCYLKLMEAYGHIQRWNIEDNNLARRLVEETIAICPENPHAYLALGWVYHHDYALGNTKVPRETLDKSIELAQKALSLDDYVGGHGLLCALYAIKGEHDKAVAEGERAVSLDPGGTDALNEYAWSLNHASRWEEAIPLFQKAIRLNPFGKSSIYRGLGVALLNTGRLEEAVLACKKAIQRSSNDIFSHINLAAAYSMMDREKEARIETAEVFRINSKFSLDKFTKSLPPAKDQAKRDAFINALRKAGLQDKPPTVQP